MHKNQILFCQAGDPVASTCRHYFVRMWKIDRSLDFFHESFAMDLQNVAPVWAGSNGLAKEGLEVLFQFLAIFFHKAFAQNMRPYFGTIHQR